VPAVYHLRTENDRVSCAPARIVQHEQVARRTSPKPIFGLVPQTTERRAVLRSKVISGRVPC
jgi:hypothetical protein